MEKYTEKKQRNQVFKNFIERHIGENQMDLVKNCNTFLSFVTDKKFEKRNYINRILVRIDFVRYVRGVKQEKMH